MPDEWEGHDERECGEHRTTGTRAWCFNDHEWCYPNAPCRGCELPILRRRLDSAIDQWTLAELAVRDGPVWFNDEEIEVLQMAVAGQIAYLLMRADQHGGLKAGSKAQEHYDALIAVGNKLGLEL